jgi:hypothetical protein
MVGIPTRVVKPRGSVGCLGLRYAAAGTFARAAPRLRRAAGFTISARKRPVYEVSAFAATCSGVPTCPGIGQSTSGRLCVYGYNTINVASVSPSLNDQNRRFGFSLDVLPADPDGDGFLLANWAYQIP